MNHIISHKKLTIEQVKAVLAEGTHLEISKEAEEAIIKCFDNDILEWNAIKGKIKDALTTYIYSITKRKPMILPVIMEV